MFLAYEYSDYTLRFQNKVVRQINRYNRKKGNDTKYKKRKAY